MHHVETTAFTKTHQQLWAMMLFAAAQPGIKSYADLQQARNEVALVLHSAAEEAQGNTEAGDNAEGAVTVGTEQLLDAWAASLVPNAQGEPSGSTGHMPLSGLQAAKACVERMVAQLTATPVAH